MARCSHKNLFFREERKKRHLSVDKHFPFLVKNDINIGGENDAVVILAAKGLFGESFGHSAC